MKYMSSLCGRLELWVMLVLALLSTSCGGVSQGLLDSVPASAAMVASIDADVILTQAGCQLTGDTVILTPELSRILSDKATGALSAPVEVLSDLRGAVDMSHVILFALEGKENNPLLAAQISDLDLFGTRMAGMADEAAGTDLLDMYAVGDWSVAVAGDRMWCAAMSPSQLAETVTPLLSIKTSDSVASMTGIADFLTGGDAFDFAVRPSAVNPLSGDSSSSRWSCVSGKIEDSVIGLDFRMMESDGRLMNMAEGMQEVDADFLRYVPQSYVFAAAAGFSPDYRWKEVLGSASLILGPARSSYLSVLDPVLSKIDGTVAFAAGPAAGAPAVARVGLDTWDLLVMVHMPQVDVDNALSMLRSYASMSGLKMDTDNNVTVATMPDGSKIYAGNIDGYLAVSNRELDASGSNAMTDVFLSHQAAMTLNVPAGSEIVKALGLPCGFDLSARMSADNVNVRMSLNGSDRRVLQSLMEFAVRH